MSAEIKTSRSLVGATNIIFLDGEIYKAHRSSSENRAELWAIAQAAAHTTFGSPTREEMVGINSQYTYWQTECPERAKRISSFLLALGIEVPELGIVK